MIVIGLTGSIGMGKSRVAAMFRRLGVPVHDSDQAVHGAFERKGDVFERIRNAFPETYKRKEHTIDRQLLGARIFSDSSARRELESILHPAVRISQNHFIRAVQAKGMRVAVLDIPLLFETGAEKRVDVTVCVTAPYATQKRRVLARKNMSEEKFERVLASQMPDLQKRNLSDFVVQTGVGYAHTFRQVRAIVMKVSSSCGK